VPGGRPASERDGQLRKAGDAPPPSGLGPDARAGRLPGREVELAILGTLDERLPLDCGVDDHGAFGMVTVTNRYASTAVSERSNFDAASTAVLAPGASPPWRPRKFVSRGNAQPSGVTHRNSPGTRYETRYGNRASPTCGYQYSAPSSTLGNPHGRFTVMATTAWRIDWAGGGDAGTLTVTRQSQSSVEIGEVVVLGQ
jgi:hypothetical protein